MASNAFIAWLPSIEMASGTSAATAGFHQLLLNGSGIAGSLICSALMHRARDQVLLAATTAALFTASTAGVLFAPAAGATWAVLIGIAGGSSIVLSLSFFGLRTTDHAQAASLSGMAQSIGYLLAAAGPVLLGAIHDATGSWTIALLTLVVNFSLLIVVGCFAGRDRYVRP